MKISTKGRYALRVMIDLAEHYSEKYIPLKEIAERQEISLKYLERIVSTLSKQGYLDGLHGKGGGYRLNRSPDEYTVAEILHITEGSLAPISCLESDEMTCKRAPYCKTLSMWKKFYEITEDYFGSVTIMDLIQNNKADSYVI